MFKLTDEQAEKAAQWWANRVCAPIFNGLSDEERKNPRNTAYQMAEVMATMAVEPVSDSKREKFIAALKTELQAEKYNPYWGLSVDYGPCATLHHAAKKAGVPQTNFPWKTNMSFREDGTVAVSMGYATPYESI